MGVFVAEANNSAGENFGVFKVGSLLGGSSVLVPASFLMWGADSGNMVVTDTGDPFPVRLYGNNSAAPVFVESNSGQPLFVRGVGSTTVPISGTITVSSIGQSSVTIAGGQSSVTLAAGANDSTSPVFVNNSSSNPMFVRGPNSTAVSVAIVSGADGNDTTVTAILNGGQSSVTVASGSITVTNDSTDLLYVSDSNTPVFVRGVGSSAIPIVGANDSTTPVFVNNDTTTPMNTTYIGRQQVGVDGLSSAGGLQMFHGVISSLATTVHSSVARLYGYHVGNPDTAGNVFLKVYDDTGSPTLGTDTADMDLFIPFGGGATMPLGPMGVSFSSGIVLAAAGAAGSTDHTAPSTSLVVTLFYIGG